MVLSLQKANMFFDSFANNGREEKLYQRAQNQKIFDDAIYSSSNDENLKDVSVDTLVSIVSDIDGYCGGKFKEDVQIKEVVNHAFSFENVLKRVRIL